MLCFLYDTELEATERIERVKFGEHGVCGAEPPFPVPEKITSPQARPDDCDACGWHVEMACIVVDKVLGHGK